MELSPSSWHKRPAQERRVVPKTGELKAVHPHVYSKLFPLSISTVDLNSKVFPNASSKHYSTSNTNINILSNKPAPIAISFVDISSMAIVHGEQRVALLTLVMAMGMVHLQKLIPPNLALVLPRR